MPCVTAALPHAKKTGQIPSMHTAVQLTARQARFIDEYLVDANGRAAAMRAGYSSAGAKMAAHRALSNVTISGAIEARQRQDATRLGMDRDRVLAGLLGAVEMAREQLNPAAMVQGLREIGKLMGYYAPKQMRVALDEGQAKAMARFEAMSDAELLALMAGSPASEGSPL